MMGEKKERRGETKGGGMKTKREIIQVVQKKLAQILSLPFAEFHR